MAVAQYEIRICVPIRKPYNPNKETHNVSNSQKQIGRLQAKYPEIALIDAEEKASKKERAAGPLTGDVYPQQIDSLIRALTVARSEAEKRGLFRERSLPKVKLA